MDFKSNRGGLGFLLKTMFLALLLSSMSGVAAPPPESNVLRGTLKNGLQVIIVRNALAPVVTTIINYRVGSDEAPAGFPGTAHAEEHMMFRGSPGLSAGQLANISAGIGGDFNADTQQTATQYFFTTPTEDLELALRIEAIRMRGALNTEELWKKERLAIEQEVAQDLSNPEYLLYTKLIAGLFAGTPYQQDALGTRPSFRKTTGAMLKKFHDTWYVPNNAVLVIVGDVQLQATLDKVDDIFGGIRSKPLPARADFHFQPVEPRSFTLETDAPTGMAVIAFRLPGSDSPDYAAAQVLSDVLSSQRGDLYGLVPQGKALFASFEYDALPKAGIGFAGAGFPAEADSKALLKQVQDIIAEAATKGLREDLVEAAKRREVISQELQKNSITGLAMAWSQAVAIEGKHSPEDDIEAIRRVTVQDVNRVARECLLMDHAITATLVPKASGEPVSNKSFGGKESLTAAPSKGVKVPRWAAKTLQRLDVPTSSLNPIVTHLPNGLLLIVQTNSISSTVSVYGQVKNNPDVETDKGKEGADQVLDQLFSYGSRSLDRLAFQAALDEIGAIESAGAEFSLQVLPEHFERGVELLADNQLSPALPEEAFKVTQEELAAAVAGELKSPTYHESRALKKSLFPPHDPIQRETLPSTVKGLSLEDVNQYYRKVFRPDLTTIVVVGKISPDRAREVISKYFGTWNSEGPKPNTLLPTVPTNAPARFEVPDASRVQDKVTLAEVVTLTRTNAEYYPLELGNHVLGGAFYATRLYRDLRENGGLVYFVSSDFEMGQTRSVYKVSYACDPENVAKARSIVVDNLKRMQASPVSAEELRQAKTLLLRQLPLSESSVERIAQGWIYRSLHDLPLDEPTRAAHIYLKLSADDIQQAYRKWVRPSDLVEVTLGPAPE